MEFICHIYTTVIVHCYCSHACVHSVLFKALILWASARRLYLSMTYLRMFAVPFGHGVWCPKTWGCAVELSFGRTWPLSSFPPQKCVALPCRLIPVLKTWPTNEKTYITHHNTHNNTWLIIGSLPKWVWFGPWLCATWSYFIVDV